jgi:hypothetical protein
MLFFIFVKTMLIKGFIILTLITTLATTPTIANTDLNTPNKTTTIVGSNLQANANNAVNTVNTNNGQININSGFVFNERVKSCFYDKRVASPFPLPFPLFPFSHCRVENKAKDYENTSQWDKTITIRKYGDTVWGLPSKEIIQYMRDVFPKDIEKENDDKLIDFWFSEECPQIGWEQITQLCYRLGVFLGLGRILLSLQ